MESREIVLRAIEHRCPPRLPITYCNRDFDHSDILANGMGGAAGFVPSEPGMTEWGFVWGSLDKTMGQPHNHPLADPDRIAGYVAPDPLLPERYAHLPGWLEANRDKFLRGSIGITGFNQVTFLRGFEAFLEDLAMEPDRANRLMDIVFDFENAAIARLCEYPFDCIVFGDDWGTQKGLMISPKQWRQLFKPRYAEQFAMIRKSGKKVWFHCCGNIGAVIEDFIEIGVDVLELLQPDVFGIEWLARNFGGRVCFCCSVDHQRVASTGTPDEIEAYVDRLVRTLGAFDGGFIGYIEDYNSLGMTEENYQAIRRAFHAR